VVGRIFLKAKKKDRVGASRFLSSDIDGKFVIFNNEFKVKGERDGKWEFLEVVGEIASGLHLNL
jgi:hypothetical protein